MSAAAAPTPVAEPVMMATLREEDMVTPKWSGDTGSIMPIRRLRGEPLGAGCPM
jgi:hypothetical protein